MDKEGNENISLQILYNSCKQQIIENTDMLLKVLEKLSQYEILEQRGEPIIIKSWINTIDSLDVSMLLTETMDVINKLIKTKDIYLYLLIITEITVILNNIFYTKCNSYKKFWLENSSNIYYGIVCNFQMLNKLEKSKEIVKSDLNYTYINEYYHVFFNLFREKCQRIGLNIDIGEFFL